MNNNPLIPSSEAYRLIRSFESLRCRAYKALPTEKYYTIGYGHCSPKVAKNELVTPKRAEEMLVEDVEKYSHLLAGWNPTLTQRQYDALVSLIYNIGWYNFRFSMTGVYVRELNTSRNPIDVARRIILWVRSADKVILGLQKRRCIEANYFLGYECFNIENGQIYEHSI